VLDAAGYAAGWVEEPRVRGSGSPGIAALLSLLIPGLGQAWLGAVQRGMFIAAPIVIGLAAILGYLAGGDRKTLLDTFLRPGVILAILIAIIGLGVYHVVAIQDAYRLGLRRAVTRPGWVEQPGPARPGRRGLQALLSPLLLVAVAVAIGLYGTLTIVGVKAYDAAAAIFVKPETGFVIPGMSLEPTSGPSGPLPSQLFPPEPTATPVPGPVWAEDGRLNLLLIGSDAGPGRWELRSDTMMVLSVDVASARAVLFGIPRNLINVPLPAESKDAFPNGRYPGLLNSLYVYAVGHPKEFPGGEAAGFRALTGAIQELVGVPLDGALVVNLTGFVDLVDAVGGLWIDVPFTLYDEHYPSGAGQVTVYVPAGCQKLDGTGALQYARSRHSSDDYSRMRRQQLVLTSLAHQLDPMKLLAKVPKLLDVARDNLWTTIDQDEIANLAALAARVDARTIRSVMIEPPIYPEVLTTAAIRNVRQTVRTIFDEPDGPTSTPALGGPSKSCPPKG
jgi:polyisoprenyl-teichoic acid--peptidoglycan teichoic acid transferase